MSIRDWPVSERPREKLLAKGAHYLSDAELLAVLMGGSARNLLTWRHYAQALARNATAVILALNHPLCCAQGVTTGSEVTQFGARLRH
jgi:DNA repair protein RadC